jgi:MFS family permease
MSRTSLSDRLSTGLVALRERNFALYAIGQFASQQGNWIEITAVSWILYEMTNSPLLLGLSGLIRAVPMIVLLLFGGAIADRVPKRLLLMVTESTMLIVSLVLGLLALSDSLQVWHLYLLNFVSGTFSAFSMPARHALFGGLVPRSAIQSAVVINSLTVRSGFFIGPSIAGLTLAFGGNALPFFLNAFSFIAILFALGAMRLPPVETNSSTPRLSLGRGISEGLRFVWQNPLLRVVLALDIVTGLFGHNTTLITILASDVLGTGPQGLGFLLSAIGAGALLGMSLMVTVNVSRHGLLILTAGVLYVVLWAGFGLSPWLSISALLLFALGVVDGVWSVTRNTLAQLLVTDAIRGRVMSVVTLVTRGSSLVGRFQAGVLVEFIGGPAAVLAGAAVIGTAIIGSWRTGKNAEGGQSASHS